MKVAAIVGPTAAGKSAVAVDVAQVLEGEIVSIDSMQIYRGMDAGTAKPTPSMRARVPHHLVDIAEPANDITVAEFQLRARAAIAEIHDKARLPILVGGSGLYFRAVVDDLIFPPREMEIRAALEEEAQRFGAESLHDRLRELDPVAAARIEPSNTRRTIRALEVIEATGRPFSENVTWDSYESIYELAVAGLAYERSVLYERISARTDEMMRGGLMEEARAIEANGLSRTARQALGYRQVLDASSKDADSVREEIVRATKRFARRQESWFKADPRITWFDATRANLPEALVAFFRSSLALP